MTWTSANNLKFEHKYDSDVNDYTLINESSYLTYFEYNKLNSHFHL